MKSIHLFAFMAGLMLTVACGGPEADWVYGTWSEALTGETVEFKNDKTLRWFNGAEGSFSFKRNDEILCNFTSCPDGILVLNVDNQTFRFGYQVNDGAYEWTMRFKNRAGLGPAEQTVLGLPTDTLVLKRGNVAAYAPESFVEAGEGLERLYASISGGGVVNGEIVGTFYSQNSFSAVFNRDTNEWQRLSRAGQFIGGDVELGQKVILDRGFGASNAFSLDTGASWRVFPGINEAVSGAIRTRSRFIDTVVYQIIEKPFEDGNRDYREARPQWLYRLNLSVVAPAWERVFEFPSNFTTDRYYLQLLTHEERNELYVVAKASNEELVQSAPVVVLRSRDSGASFDEMSLPTGVTSQSEARIYDGGLVFSAPDYESKHLNSLWYVAEEERWISHSTYVGDQPILTGNHFVDGESLVSNIWACQPVGPSAGNRAECQVQRLSIDGTVSTIVEVSEVRGFGYQTPHITVIDGEVFLNALTVWRLMRP